VNAVLVFAKLNDSFLMLDENRPRHVQDTLAQNLRRLRIARHLSLSELARATRISKATLSSIENGRANPTVDTLASLAAALRISLGELLEEPPVGEVRVVRVSHGGSAPERALESFVASGELALAEVAMPARELRETAAQPAGSRVHVYVLSGQLLTGPAERVTELAAGDYASFPTDLPHVYETMRQPARMLLLRATGT
jgi:transcriptional regulator with XRE-family HTH domain